MRSITEVRERQTGERNLTGLRESKSQDGYDRQREEKRIKMRDAREIDRCREGELDNGAAGEREERGTCEEMRMELLRGPGCCNLLSMANTQQMCGAEDWERRRGAGLIGG